MYYVRVWNPFKWAADKLNAYRVGEIEMVDLNRRLYSIIEIRRSFGRMMKKELDDLKAEGILTPEEADIIARRLAFRFCAWDLHPPKREQPKPDPVQVKAAIRARLSGAAVKVMQLNLPKLPALSLEEMLRMHLHTRK